MGSAYRWELCVDKSKCPSITGNQWSSLPVIAVSPGWSWPRQCWRILPVAAINLVAVHGLIIGSYNELRHSNTSTLRWADDRSITSINAGSSVSISAPRTFMIGSMSTCLGLIYRILYSSILLPIRKGNERQLPYLSRMTENTFGGQSQSTWDIP